MLKNFAVLVGAGGGGIAVVGTWYVLERWHSSQLAPEWLGIWSYGLALGSSATLTCAAAGGTSVADCVRASVLGAGLTTAMLVALGIVVLAHELPVLALPFVAFYLMLWLGATATILLIAPATAVTLALLGAARIARSLGIGMRMS